MTDSPAMRCTVTELFEGHGMGYGNPAVSISLAEQRASGELRPEVEAAAVQLIISSECLHPVQYQDDGCIDGRLSELLRWVNEAGELEEEPAGHLNGADKRRALVASGGYLTARAMLVGAFGPGTSALGDLQRAIELLSQQGVLCGAHVGAHALVVKGTTDCGACDKGALIFSNAVKFEQQISDNIASAYAAMARALPAEALSTAFAHLAAADENRYYFEGVSGTSQMEYIRRALVSQNGQPANV